MDKNESKSPPRKSTTTKIEKINRFIVKTTEIEYIIEQPVNQQLNHVFGL
jgi:hypothetical protein